MRTNRSITFDLRSSLLLTLFAYGACTPPAASPAEAPHVETNAASSASPAATPPDDPAASKPASAPEAPAPAPSADTSLEKPTRPVRSILEAGDTVFFLSYEDSDAGKTAEANCTKESGGDPQKNSACMTKARQSLEGNGYRFKKKGDITTCTMLKRSGNALSTLHKFRYKYGDETENSIVIKMEGKDEGPIKWEKVPSEFKVDVPNDYTIVVQDPKHGRLVYSAKAGIPGD